MKTHSSNKGDIITGFKEGVIPSLAIIKAKIDAALNYEPLDVNKVNIDISGNKVILSGIVETQVKMYEIVYSVWEAPGVDYVENSLQLLNKAAA